MLDLNYTPEIVVDTSNQTTEEWEKQRSIGIGGSEGAAILGKSKFQTNLDVYYRKIGRPDDKADDIKQFLFDCGHAMEPMVARAFMINHPDWKVMNDTIMYRHPKFPFMIADVDFVAVKPSGEKVIVECKFVTHESSEVWREAPPEYYKIQCRHYMSVLNLNEVYLCALWGNNPINDYTEWVIQRDLDFEEEYIKKLRRFWECVQTRTEPKLVGGYARSVIASVKKFHPVESDDTIDLGADRDLNEVLDILDNLEDYLKKSSRYKTVKNKLDALKDEMDIAQAKVVTDLDGHLKGFIKIDGGCYYITNRPSSKKQVDVSKLKSDYPDLYDQLAKISVTVTDLKRASAEAYKACTVDIQSETTRLSVTRR